jgi:hypothetical protein
MDSDLNRRHAVLDSCICQLTHKTNMNEYLIPEELLKVLIVYLRGRPYAEVYQAVVVLENLPKHEKQATNEPGPRRGCEVTE